MRRWIMTAALAAVLTATLPATAGPPAVGGAKSTSMAFAFSAPGPQQHVLAETSGTAVDPGVIDSCQPPRCYAFPFVLAANAKGAKGAQVSAQITWPTPTSRFRLRLMDITKDPTILANCYTFYTSAGTSATVTAPLKVGRKYAVWVPVEQVLTPSEQVKGVVHAPATDHPPASRISGADPTGLLLNPCQG